MNPALPRVHQHLARTSLIRDVREHGRRGAVVVPQIVMDLLEVPLVGAGLQVERDDRHGEQIVAAALCAVVVRTGVASRDVNHPEVGIDRRMRPNRRAAVLPGIAFPRVVAKLARTRNRPELPDFLAGLRVVGAELPADARLAAANADVHEAVVIDRRRVRVAPRRRESSSRRPHPSSGPARGACCPAPRRTPCLRRRPGRDWSTTRPTVTGPSGYRHFNSPVRASRAAMWPVAMYIVPSTTTGVACMRAAAAVLGVHHPRAAEPVEIGFDRSAPERRVALVGEVAADEREISGGRRLPIRGASGDECRHGTAPTRALRRLERTAHDISPHRRIISCESHGASYLEPNGAPRVLAREPGG